MQRHVLTTFGRIAENAKPEDDGVPFFCMGSKRIAPGPSPPPKTRLAGAGEALSYPARRPWAGDDPEVFSKRLRRMGGGLPPTTPYTRVAEGGPKKSDVEPGQLPARRVAHVNAHTRVLHDMC